jgi:hypothetical protein
MLRYAARFHGKFQKKNFKKFKKVFKNIFKKNKNWPAGLAVKGIRTNSTKRRSQIIKLLNRTKYSKI